MADSGRWDRDEVRRRPGMYIGSVGSRGLAHLVLEVVANAVDLALAGSATTIGVTVHDDDSIEVSDDGPGVDLTSPVVRGYFEQSHDEATADGHHPHVHLSGLGVGVAVVNMLSERLRVTTVHAGHRHVHEWLAGAKTHRVIDLARSREPTGTSVRLWPDPVIFGGARLQSAYLLDTLAEYDHLIPNLHISFAEARLGPSDHGLQALFERRFAGRSTPWHVSHTSAAPDGSTIDVDVAVGAAASPHHSEALLLYCNFREVTESASGLHAAVREALGVRPDEHGRGINVAASLRMLSPTYSGPTKGRVDDPVACAAMRAAITALLDAHPEVRVAVGSD